MKSQVGCGVLIEMVNSCAAVTAGGLAASLWDGPALHVEVELFAMGGEYSGARRILVSVERVCDPLFSQEGVNPRNAHVIRRAKRAVELGLPAAVPEPEFNRPEVGVTEGEFQAKAEEFRQGARWGAITGWAYPKPFQGYTFKDGYLTALSHEGATRFIAWYGGGSRFDAAHRFAEQEKEVVQQMDDITRGLLQQLACTSEVLEREMEQIRSRDVAQAEAREREVLAREFGVLNEGSGQVEPDDAYPRHPYE